MEKQRWRCGYGGSRLDSDYNLAFVGHIIPIGCLGVLGISGSKEGVNEV